MIKQSEFNSQWLVIEPGEDFDPPACKAMCNEIVHNFRQEIEIP